ncbi:N-formylglutamate amidohydrolase [Rubrivivax sp. RP6-9]|uniref:N-formylglutamate amidohydrolase n=1 Tax=Rubrivivax sp. RP6-9 TaxID=3415750 RepID=UPI003CC663A8
MNVPPPLSIDPPAATPIALVCDSPHSGTAYPDDFGHAVDLADLRRCEDTLVDALWSGVPGVGGALLHAHFPRSYIDANRACTDIEAALLDAPWPGELCPSDRATRLGNGLIYSKTTTLAPIYARRLGVDEVRSRIERCWRPYRAALRTLIDATRTRHGRVWHLNLHSMPSNAYERLGLASDRPLADVVLGDLRGVSCSAAFTRCLAEAFESLGYTVAVNDPYTGQDLLRVHGRPEQGCESLQVELNRQLYLDETTREPSARFERMRQDIDLVLQQVARFVRARTDVSSRSTPLKDAS